MRSVCLFVCWIVYWIFFQTFAIVDESLTLLKEPILPYGIIPDGKDQASRFSELFVFLLIVALLAAMTAAVWFITRWVNEKREHAVALASKKAICEFLATVNHELRYVIVCCVCSPLVCL
jgi:hypothetical protein